VERPRGTETILLVDDEKSIRVTTQRFLEALGYTVLAAAEPEEALRLASQHAGEIQLLISDVLMPGMSGPDLANRLHESRAGMKSLFMSGYSADIIEQRLAPEAALQFMEKPFTRETLARKVRGMLGT
jgi:CheY-like chemotaxis protein